jgi:hypothetical protein
METVMKAIRLAVLGTILLWRVPMSPAQTDLPPAAKEVLKQFEQESIDIEKKVEPELEKTREKACVELKKQQDLFCKEARLDEAVAIRDLIRSLKANRAAGLSDDLPAAAREIYKQYEADVEEVYRKADFEAKKGRETTAVELKKIQDLLCKEDKLDEAIAVRDAIRLVRLGVTAALPDPGYVNNGAQDIGNVYYYQTTGVITGGAIYGTDVFTTGSHLGMAAVHSGILKEGQKGVVKVTILPGQANYPSTTRNGITSTAYGAYNVSFKVERVYGLIHRQPQKVPQPEKATQP